MYWRWRSFQSIFFHFYYYYSIQTLKDTFPSKLYCYSTTIKHKNHSQPIYLNRYGSALPVAERNTSKWSNPNFPNSIYTNAMYVLCIYFGVKSVVDNLSHTTLVATHSFVLVWPSAYNSIQCSGVFPGRRQSTIYPITQAFCSVSLNDTIILFFAYGFFFFIVARSFHVVFFSTFNLYLVFLILLFSKQFHRQRLCADVISNWIPQMTRCDDDIWTRQTFACGGSRLP